jgi:hypothetical protein
MLVRHRTIADMLESLLLSSSVCSLGHRSWKMLGYWKDEEMAHCGVPYFKTAEHCLCLMLFVRFDTAG